MKRQSNKVWEGLAFLDYVEKQVKAKRWIVKTTTEIPNPPAPEPGNPIEAPRLVFSPGDFVDVWNVADKENEWLDTMKTAPAPAPVTDKYDDLIKDLEKLYG